MERTSPVTYCHSFAESSSFTLRDLALTKCCGDHNEALELVTAQNFRDCFLCLVRQLCCSPIDARNTRQQVVDLLFRLR